jgi:carbon monoxide dehydrogenase subunit G
VARVITIERVVTVDRPVETVFAYLSDFETTVEWEPGTLSTVKVSGDGGVGTKYANTSSLAGRETKLEYVVQQFEPAQLFQVRGENRSVNALGTLTLRPSGDGTEVTYRAEVEFKGVTRLLEPLLKPQLKKLADETEQGMHKALQNL